MRFLREFSFLLSIPFSSCVLKDTAQPVEGGLDVVSNRSGNFSQRLIVPVSYTHLTLPTILLV